MSDGAGCRAAKFQGRNRMRLGGVIGFSSKVACTASLIYNGEERWGSVDASCLPRGCSPSLLVDRPSGPSPSQHNIIASGAWVRQWWLSMLGAPHHPRDRDRLWRLDISDSPETCTSPFLPSCRFLVAPSSCKASVSELAPPVSIVGRSSVI